MWNVNIIIIKLVVQNIYKLISKNYVWKCLKKKQEKQVANSIIKYI